MFITVHHTFIRRMFMFITHRFFTIPSHLMNMVRSSQGVADRLMNVADHRARGRTARSSDCLRNCLRRDCIPLVEWNAAMTGHGHASPLSKMGGGLLYEKTIHTRIIIYPLKQYLRSICLMNVMNLMHRP